MITTVAEAIEDYGRIWPVPFALSANLQLASQELGEAFGLLSQLVDPDPCEWDHNHSCQAHGFFYLPYDKNCPNQLAREWVESHDQR